MRIRDPEGRPRSDPAKRAGGVSRRHRECRSLPARAHGRIERLERYQLLTVAVDRLRQWWRSGLLCLGDSAHAMSPVGGVGINLAIQDAVAAANILVEPLLRGAVRDEQLREVQERREYPTRMTQRFQIFAHKHLLGPALSHKTQIRQLPLPFKLLRRFPVLRRIPARMLGLGFRPEHVRTPETQVRIATMDGT